MPPTSFRSAARAAGRRAALALLLGATAGRASAQSPAPAPVPVVFDTDMGNDVDDALALAMLHALENRGESRLLAVTVTKDERYAAPYVDLLNTFYGRPDVPVGVVHSGVTPRPNFPETVATMRDAAGRLVYPHRLLDGRAAPEAAVVLRRALAGAADSSVVVVQVGFSTNLARLLDTPPDTLSPLPGRALVARKVRRLVVMAGYFGRPAGAPARGFVEFNVGQDVASARALFAGWPGPVEVSGWEVGNAIVYPAASVERDYGYAAHHPVRDAYLAYRDVRYLYDRPTWDLTAALQAVRPDRGYFGLSAPGRVTVDARGAVAFRPEPGGPHRYFTLAAEQGVRAREAMVALASEPPRVAGAAPNATPNATPRAAPAADSFANPIVASRDAGDPWVVRDGGWYYFTATLDADSGVAVWRARTLTGLDSGEKRRVWRAPASGPGSRQIWAPELHRLGGAWYLYFTASDGVDAHHRLYAMRARTGDPLGAYDPPVRVDPAERYAIDASVLALPDGRLYLLYCADGPENGVYIAPMADPLHVAGRAVRIVRGTEPWEHGWRLAGGRWTQDAGYWVEAPEPLVHDGRVFLTYSAGHTATPHYYVGLLALAPGGDPMDPDAWTKRREPVLAPYAGPDGAVYTPGHNGFTASPDGRESWIVYHAKDGGPDATGGNEGSRRTVRAQRFTWGADGEPRFERPAPSGVLLRKPSGE